MEYRKDDKSNCLATINDHFVSINGNLRKLSVSEWEILQTLPKDYTSGVSENQRYRMIGNGWTIDVIAHILTYLKSQ